MKTSSKIYLTLKSILGVLISLAMLICGSTTHVYAAERPPGVVSLTEGSVTFSNVDRMRVGDILKYETIDKNGKPATISIEKVERAVNKVSSNSNEWKVSYTGGVINSRFYMTVTNNRVTSVYDDWILIVGGSYDETSLVKTSIYGKLSFKVTAYGGVMSAKCWLKGTVTGSGNNITVSYQM